MPNLNPRLCALAAVLLALPTQAQTADELFETRKNVTLVGRVVELLAGEYVEPIDAQRTLRAGLTAMTASLDPYTVFYDEAATAAGRLEQGRDVGGVGVVVGQAPGGLVVVTVLDGSSAEAQGVRPGDAIVRVAGREASELTPAAASALLRGEPGSAVAVEVDRTTAAAVAGGEPERLRFQLLRADEPRAGVSFAGFVGDPAEGVALVRLVDFLGPASEQILTALAGVRETGEVRAVILDLRGNPGGLLTEAVAVSGIFLPPNTRVVQTRGRAEGTASTYPTLNPPAFPDVPVAVLIDRRSASASEIVAGALQDYDRAVVVGEPSFGKGLVQVVRPMPFGTALKLTVSRYTTPLGREIQRLETDAARAAARPSFRTPRGRALRGSGGIEPDVAVDAGEPSELEAALDRGAALARFANRYAAQNPSLPADWRVTDAVWADFRRFVAAEALDYQTGAERALVALERELSASSTGAPAEVAALRRALEREKARDLERHAPRLRARLRQEILARGLGQRALAEAALADDAALARARALVTDRRAYDRALGR